MSGKIDQYSVYWVDLNPTKGAKINKTRPCVVISPAEMNNHLHCTGNKSWKRRISYSIEV